MRKLLLTLTLFIGSLGLLKAQTDFCKDIVKSVTDGIVLYTAPTPGPVSMTKNSLEFSLVKGISGGVVDFELEVGTTSSESGIAKSDLTIVFDDKDQITCSVVSLRRGDENEIGTYYYSGIAALTSDDMVKLKTKKLKLFTFVGETVRPF